MLWALALQTMWYLLPSFQFVAFSRQEIHKLGDSQYCYYDYLCAKPYVFTFFNIHVPSFHNICSNGPYIVFGIVYMALVFFKYFIFEEERKQKTLILLSLGASLFMEGIFSAFYHVCPSTYEFQFDATFIYTILLLHIAVLLDLNTPTISRKEASEIQNENVDNSNNKMQQTNLASQFSKLQDQSAFSHWMMFAAIILLAWLVVLEDNYEKILCYVLFLVFINVALIYLFNKLLKIYKEFSLFEMSCCFKFPKWLFLALVILIESAAVIYYIVIFHKTSEDSFVTISTDVSIRLIHLAIVVCFSYHFYEAMFLFQNKNKCININKTKKIAIFIFFIVNIGYMIVTIPPIVQYYFEKPLALPSYFLFALAINWLLLLLYFIQLKTRILYPNIVSCKSKFETYKSFWIFVICLLICGSGIFVAAGVFYLMTSYKTDLSSVKSLEWNFGCLILDMYDAHDLWHIFSALSLFLIDVAILFFHEDCAYGGACSSQDKLSTLQKQNKNFGTFSSESRTSSGFGCGRNRLRKVNYRGVPEVFPAPAPAGKRAFLVLRLRPENGYFVAGKNLNFFQ